MKIQIKNMYTFNTIIEAEKENIKEMIEKNKDKLERVILQKLDLRGINLEGVSLRGSDLRESDLRESNLQKADLQGVALEGSSLQESNLQGANIQGADLCDVNFQNANLQKVDFRYSCLQYADLSRSDLQGSKFNYVDLKYANLWKAKIKNNQLQDIIEALGFSGDFFNGFKNGWGQGYWSEKRNVHVVISNTRIGSRIITSPDNIHWDIQKAGIWGMNFKEDKLEDLIKSLGIIVK